MRRQLAAPGSGFLLLILIFSSLTTLGQTPPNDDCSNAIDIPVESGSCTSPLYSNDGATLDGADPIPSCWTPDGPDNTVWFTFEATGTAVQISTNFGTPVTNTQVAVFSGSCGSMTELACQEDLYLAGGVTHVTLIADGLIPGDTYYIMVDGNLGEEGGFSICAEEVFVSDPEPNQDCPTGEFLCDKDPISIPDGPGNDGLIEEVPSCFGGTGERASHWYLFTAENDGSFTFEVTPTSPTDYDWALFDITGSPTGTCDLSDEISCNWSGVIGVTGMGCGGAPCEPAEMLEEGHTYALIIDRWTAGSAAGFDLEFGGTVEFANPDADFNATTVCVGQATSFNNLTEGSNLYSWTFGDGFTSSDDNPVHTYAAPGDYEVTLIATANPGGCTGVVVQTVTVVEGPELTIDPSAPVICEGDDVVLDLTYTLTGSDCPPQTFSNDTDIPIPAGPSISSDIDVSGVSPSTFSPANLESVCLDINHTFVADLDISLQCPDGTTIVLSSDNGGGGNNYTGTCFVVSGAPPVTTGAAPFTGDYTPEQPFSAMTGCDVNGTWSLIVDDDLTGDLGTLLGWSITFACENGVESLEWTPGTGLSSTTDEDPVAMPSTTTTYTVTLTELSGCSASEDVTVTVESPPIAGFSYSSPEFCEEAADETPVLDAGATSGSWSASPAGLIIDLMDGTIDLTLSDPGTYTITNFVAGVGSCPDASEDLSITIHPSFSIGETVSICSGETYVLPDGTTVGSAGVYTSILTSVDGCDSIITTNLTVTLTSTLTEDIEICEGGSYTLPDGTVVTDAGTYTSTLTTIDGCDSIISTNLTVTLTSTLTEDVEICEGDSYTLPDGTVVTDAGTYTSTLTTVDGCDSIITTNLTVSDAYLITLTPSICEDDIYTLPDGTDTSDAGVYTYTFVSALGCDSVVEVDLTVTPTFTLTEDVEICEGGSYTLPDGTAVTDAGTYTSTLTTIDGCDSIITTNLTLTLTSTLTEDIEICDGGSYTLPDGTVVTDAGTYTSNLTTIDGCDSIITTNLTVSDAYLITLMPSICEGETYILPDGSTTSDAGTYSYTFTSATGCDSIVDVELTLTPTFTLTEDIEICEGETYILPDGSTTTDAGSYSYTFTSALGCDSIVDVELTLTPTFTLTEDVEICEGGSYTLPDGTVVTDAGTYTSNLTTIDGCDSIITTNLLVSDAYLITLMASICDGESFILPDGTSVTDAGVYVSTLTTADGCDSIVEVELTLTPTFTLTEDVEICEGGTYTLPDGTVVSDAGTYLSNLTTIDGCDSTITTNLIVSDAYLVTLTPSICEGDTYILPDGTETPDAGSYTYTFTSTLGCDSIVEVELTLTPTFTLTEGAEVCHGTSYILPDGTEVTDAGTYISNLTTIDGCDSIITTTLTILPVYDLLEDVVICEGSSYILPDGSEVTDAGIYISEFESINGCDSIITTSIEVGVVFTETLTPAICEGESYLLPDGTSTSDAGSYSFAFTSVLGCDSIIDVDLTVWPVYDLTEDAEICEGEAYLLPDGTSATAAGVYVSSLSTAAGCDSTITTTLTVNPVFTSTSDAVICDGEAYTLEDGTIVYAAGTYEVVLPTTEGCDSVLVTNLELIPSYDITIDTAVCDGVLYTLPDGNQTGVSGVYTFDLFTMDGCDSTVTVELTVNPLPEVNLDASTNDACIDGFLIDLVVSPAGGMAWGTGVTGTQFDPSDAGVGGPYSLYYGYTDVNGCSDTAEWLMTVHDLPIVSFLLPEYLCVEADPFDMLPVPEGGTFVGPGISDGQFVPSLAGTGGPYDITYTYTDLFGCTNAITQDVLVRENVFDAGPDTSLFIGETIQLFVFSTDILEWSPPGGLSCTDCPDPMASPIQTTTYNVTETDEYGCLAVDDILVFVQTIPDSTIFAPNSFTPNGDGVNDYFYIYGPDIAVIKSLRVFDRWGSMVFFQENLPPGAPVNGWDGTFKGQDVVSGVYAFTAEITLRGGAVVMIQGNITLLR